MRLQKYLAHAGVASRRHAEEYILAGRVQVNGETVTTLGTIVDEGDVVRVDGLKIKIPKKFTTLMMNKPRKILSSASDDRGRMTVCDLVPFSYGRVYPIGRLDWDTEGLILLTNDGELAYKLSHPSKGVEKIYRAQVKGVPDEEDLAALSNGVHVEDWVSAPGKARMINENRRKYLELTIHEGRYHQVKKMCEAIGHPVKRLWRIGYGPLRLGNLIPGMYRELTDEEVKALEELV